ncbi:MAG: serine/threonine protein kinase [Deltaproteobacteria bacterium]|nr:serine/threonine protein kinase [Deltaproteobacteria bacterium]
MSRVDADPALETFIPGESGPRDDGFDETLPRQSSGGGVEGSFDLARSGRDSYRIERELSRGGQGRILVAFDEKLRRRVALKELLRRDEDGERRFVRELLITAQLQHPSIIDIHDAGRLETGEPFYSMSLVAGRALGELIAEAGTLEDRLALLPNVLALADAVAFAHSKRIVHRDLKPGNVLVGSFGETILIDWGLAKSLDAAELADSTAVTQEDIGPSSVQTSVGSVMGTPSYMPPEQAAGVPVDERADVYALGSILYQVLSGRAPYSGPTSAVLEALQHEPPPPIATLEPRLPADLVSIVTKAMQRDPSARFATARELAAELRKYQTGQLVASHQYSAGDIIRRWVRKNRTLVMVAAFSAAALVATAAFDRQRIRRERDRAEAALAEVNRLQEETERQRHAVALMRTKLARLATPESLAEHPFTESYVESHVGALRKLLEPCYAGALSRDPSAQGTLEVELLVHGEPSTGTCVGHVRLEGAEALLRDERFRGCATDRLYNASLQAPAREAKARIRFQLVFSAPQKSVDGS